MSRMSKKNTPKEGQKERFREAAQNRRARFEYTIGSTLEAGIALVGTEVKSLRKGQASLQESFAGEHNGDLVLFNAHIPEYQQAGRHLQHDPRRPRVLLVHKRERNKLLGAVQRDGITLVPLSIYFNPRGIAKVKLGIAEGKKQHDKRNAIKAREWGREKQRLMKERN
jgi:SsrA-binding protein